MAQPLLVEKEEGKKPTPGEHRSWIFTINNWTADDLAAVKGLNYDYLCFGREVGLLRSTPHLQGYVHFERAKTFRYMKKRLRRAYLKPPNGTPDENRTYCIKEGDFEEFGIIPKQGERNDLTEVIEDIEDGKVQVDDLALTRPMLYHQYGRTFHKAEDVVLRRKRRNYECKGKWLWGDSGIGKSHWLFTGNEDAYEWKLEDKGWQDGYRGEEKVLINDFRGEIPFAQLLKLCDKWPATVPRRGREPAPFMAREILITSRYPPEQVYRDVNEDFAQLTRRFEIIHWDSIYDSYKAQSEASGQRKCGSHPIPCTRAEGCEAARAPPQSVIN